MHHTDRNTPPPKHPDRDGVILLTGATGLLGRYLLRDLLEAGHRVAVLVRPSARQEAAARVAGLLADWERRGHRLPAPHVLTGDITAPGLGLAVADARWAVRHCDLVLHNAASLEFEAEAGPDGEPWRSNVGGTRNVLDFCETAGIADVHHVSTAYVCGLRDGTVREGDGDVGQDFRNDYERSKLQAETLVRNAPGLAPPTFYRPSIIVGDSQTGFTTTFHGFYAVVRLAAALSQLVADRESVDWSFPLRGLRGDEHKNLVPVDWVSAAISDLVGRRECWGKTYHLTNGRPVSVADIRDVTEEAVGYRGTTAFDDATPAPQTAPDAACVMPDLGLGAEMQAAFADQMRVYATYFRHDAPFDRTNLLSAFARPCPPLDRPTLLRLARAAIAQNFRHRDPRPSRVPAVTT